MRTRQKEHKRSRLATAVAFSSALLLTSCGLEATQVPQNIPVVSLLQKGTDRQKFNEIGWHTKLSGKLAICTREDICEVKVHESSILLNVRFFAGGKEGNLEVMVERLGPGEVVLKNTAIFPQEDMQVKRQAVPYGKQTRLSNTDLDVTFMRLDSYETMIVLGPMDTAGP